MILCISEFGFGSTQLLTVPLSQFSLYSYMITNPEKRFVLFEFYPYIVTDPSPGEAKIRVLTEVTLASGDDPSTIQTPRTRPRHEDNAPIASRFNGMVYCTRAQSGGVPGRVRCCWQDDSCGRRRSRLDFMTGAAQHGVRDGTQVRAKMSPIM